jgi:hypothetical protein
MLTRFEHAQGDGLFDASAFVELDHRTPEQAADLILQRLALNEGLAKEHYLTAASEMKGPIRDLVYISYSHSDKVWQKKLRRVLDADPELRGLVWDDTKIAASVPFERDITDHVKRARVMVMLLSENYFRPNSGAAFYETLPALEAHKRGEMDILWVPVKAHDYRNSPVGHIMAATGAGAAPLESLPASTQKKSLQRVQQEVRRCLGLPKIITHEKRIAARSSRVASTNPLHSPPAESMHTMNTQETVPAIAGPKPPIPNAKQSPALKRWMDKLEFLQEQLAISASPAQKFELKSQIDEAKEKIVELGGQASQ